MSIDALRLLVVEPDAVLRDAIQRALGSLATIESAERIDEARRLVEASAWDGLLVEARLSDGDALDWLESVDLRRPMPCVVLTDRSNRALVNRALAVGVQLLCKPIEPHLLRAFVGRLSGVTVPRAIREALAVRGLTRREMEVVVASLQGIPRDDFVAARRISMNTYKTQVGSVLRKLDASSLSEVRERVFRSARAVWVVQPR